MTGLSITSSTKPRRTRREVDRIMGAAYRICQEEQPVTVRQVFYRLVSEGIIAKTETEYRATVCRLLADMRRQGIIPYGWIADNTRWMRKPRTWSSLEQLLRDTARTYRRALWDDQNAYVEVWLEKDALAGVVYDVTADWDVPLMVTRGYPSLSFLYSAAEHFRACQKPVYLYYFGDYDPSGVDIPRAVEKTLRDFAPHVELHFSVVAVTPGQIENCHLPTRPTKNTDSRSKRFKGESVEVDAIPPAELRDLVSLCITQHVDLDKVNQLRMVEREERRLLYMMNGEMSDEHTT